KHAAEAIVSHVAAAHPDLKLRAGVSAVTTSCFDLRQPAFQARSALASASAEASPIGLFDDLGVLRFLLSPGDRGELVEFARQVLGPAMEYDAEHSAELIPTLEIYFAEDCSLRRTAERLYLHPKTVHYRLGRIRDLTNRDLTAQKDRFDAQMALIILQALSI